MKNAIIALIMVSVLAITVAALDPIFGAQIPVSVNGENILITGEVYNVAEGTGVQLICNGNLAGEYPTDSTGAFSIATTYENCGPGTAVLKVGSAETSVTIPGQFIIVQPGGKSSKSFTYSDAAHTPEFSVITLGLAIVGVGLGLAFLRKK